MTEAERQIYDITRRFRECNTGVELTQFLESHGLIGRVIKANSHVIKNKKNSSSSNSNNNFDNDSIATEDEKEAVREEDECDLKYYQID